MAVEAEMRSERRSAAPRRSLLYDPWLRGLFYQALLVTIIGAVGYVVVSNTLARLRERNLAPSYDFLNDTAGFDLLFSLFPYSRDSTFGDALLVGLTNTLLVAAIGIVFATVLGFLIGIGRLSSNAVISALATVYVEVVRNIPLLLQLFFWYFAVLRAVPGPREKWSFLFDTFHLNITGLRGPAPVLLEGAWATFAALGIGIAASIFVAIWSRRRQASTGRPLPVLWLTLALVFGLPAAVFVATGMPIALQYPVFVESGPILRRGFQRGVGFALVPEFLALVLALSIYTAAFIAEIVRAGILAVSRGQTEAAHALGLRRGQTLRLVVIPQAMRVIIPPLTSQFLNLTKNSSLAVAIGYPDLVYVGGTVFNQNSRTFEVIAIWMIVYLGLSLTTSAFMNWYNARRALVER